jgi:hypothetical protein
MYRRVFAALIASAFLGSCGGGDANPAGPSARGYAGQWSGTTFQGQPFSFTVSSDQKVTALSVGYRFGGCSGVDTFSNLDLAINPSPPYFGYGASHPDGRGTSIQVFFQSETSGFATVIFYGPPSCGSTGESGPPVQLTKR